MFRLCLYTFILSTKKQKEKTKRAYFKGFKMGTIFYNPILSGMFYQAGLSGPSLGLGIMGDRTALKPPED